MIKEEVKSYLRPRTNDVKATNSSVGSLTFAQLLLSEPILQGLTDNGFCNPSPIQAAAIPIGRFGKDIICQAKSGTGKTCVFVVIILENLVKSNKHLQALVLAPTREIAIQSASVIRDIGKHILSPSSVEVFIGGVSLQGDYTKINLCQIAVGTPGRVKSLLMAKAMSPVHIRMVAVDEADQLFDPNFYGQVYFIMQKMPVKRQTMCFSATFTGKAKELMLEVTKDAQFISVSEDSPSLEGVKQFVGFVGGKYSSQILNNKLNLLLKILAQVPFHQCVIFSNVRYKADEIVERLEQEGWPTVCIGGEKSQSQRNLIMQQVRAFKVRIVVSTDLIARGVDVQRITLVINLDLPYDSATYLHRVGRTGRFGTLGVAITLLSGAPNCTDKIKLENIEQELGTNIKVLDSETLSELKEIPAEYFANREDLENNDLQRFESLEQKREEALFLELTKPVGEKKKKKKKNNKIKTKGKPKQLNISSEQLKEEEESIIEEPQPKPVIRTPRKTPVGKTPRQLYHPSVSQEYIEQPHYPYLSSSSYYEHQYPNQYPTSNSSNNNRDFWEQHFGSYSSVKRHAMETATVFEDKYRC